MAGEVQLCPPQSTIFRAPQLPPCLRSCPAAPQFSPAVRGSREAAMQLPLPWDQPRAQILAWQPGGISGTAAHPCQQRGTGQEERGLLEGKISHRLWAPHKFKPQHLGCQVLWLGIHFPVAFVPAQQSTIEVVVAVKETTRVPSKGNWNENRAFF